MFNVIFQLYLGRYISDLFQPLYFRHILAYSRLIQPYLILLRRQADLRTFSSSHTQTSSKHLLVFRQIQSYLEPWLIYARSIFQAYSAIFPTLDILRDIYPHSGIF